MRCVTTPFLAALAVLFSASAASAAPDLGGLSPLSGLQDGKPFALSFSVSDHARPISGYEVDFGEPHSSTGVAACRSGAPEGAFALGRTTPFSVPYTFRQAGVHVITLRVTSGGCDGAASTTQVKRVATVSLPVLPPISVPLPARAARRARGCRWAKLAPRRGDGAKLRSAILCLVNAQRRRAGLRSLRRNTALQRAADGHSASMVHRRYFAHGSVVDRLKTVRYVTPAVNWTVGENLAFGYGTAATPAGIVTMWMHSPPHRANILTRRFREGGVGVVLGLPSGAAIGATYTLDFGVRS